MKKANKKDRCFKLREAQYFLGISKNEMDQLIHDCSFPVVRIRGVSYIPRQAFFGWLEQNRSDRAA